VENPRVYKHDQQEQTFMDTPIHGKRAAIQVIRQRSSHSLARSQTPQGQTLAQSLQPSTRLIPPDKLSTLLLVM
jgi:hypothetical protein